ncbi:MAG: SUMF1/EgtB/PvdO family nonheme iron enzyme [Gemmatimonadetes bacterium]|nr:SUMF1/EgtB/PvdO family nonheme iron enzyme [Gemmatimonadota bacterium]
MSFWDELKRRKVVRVVTAYAVVAWVVVEVVTAVEEPLGLPSWTDTFVIVLLGVGFLVAAILAWAFDVTPDGVRRTAPAGDGTPISPTPMGRYAVTALGAGLFGAATVWFFTRDSDTRWLNEVALPEVEAALGRGDWQSAFAAATAIEGRLVDVPELDELWARTAWTTSIGSDPSGARVSRRPYAASEAAWEPLGETPLDDIRVPFGVSELRFELDGYATLHRTIGHGMVNFPLPELHVGLEAQNEALAGKTLVPGFSLAVGGQTISVNDFHLGHHEVTNHEFKAFVDAGGYEQQSLWEPIVVDGDTLSWDAGIRLFIDTTGRPGPSGWEAGDYPAGEGEHPVEGVSWYEAMAYARWAGEELPSAEHLWRSFQLRSVPWLLSESNFNGSGTRSVLESRAISHTGAYDLVGNVREWTSTPIGQDYVILGGSWTDPYYVVGVGNVSAPPTNRIGGNGFRLAVTTDEPAVKAAVRAVVRPAGLGRYPVPDRAPVPPELFEAYRSLFDYERGPLNEELEERIESRSWVHEVVSIDAGYRDERMRLHLYLPTVGSPPFQTVVYWPGWDTFRGGVSVEEYFSEQADFIVRSGRALAFPVYKGTFERGSGTPIPAFGSTDNRDITLDAVKDLRRSLDYLETRPDIDARSFAFYGYSWGGITAPIALAHEARLKAAVVHIGGSPDLSATPEVDPVNALPRVGVPVLILSGEFDTVMPIENARHYYQILGSSEKRHIVTRGSHFIPRNELIRESLAWLDLHLGRVR